MNQTLTISTNDDDLSTAIHFLRGSVANMLVTSCEDSICRVWVETILPEDGLVNMSNFDPLAAQNPRFRTHRHKHKFMQRLKHMRYIITFFFPWVISV